MGSEPPKPFSGDLVKQTTETIALFIRWIAELIQRRDGFMLLVLVGVLLSFARFFLRDAINRWLPEPWQNSVWVGVSATAGVVFIAALIVAVVTLPRSRPPITNYITERKAIKGLRPFGQEDAEIFARLQRDRQLRDCLEIVTSTPFRFGTLVGDSGCGKTSFLQAGLWPKLSLPAASHRGIYVRFWNQDPLESIRRATADQLEIPWDWLDTTEVERDPLLHLFQQAEQAAGKPVVFMMDQFEQFFVHYPREAERAEFINALAHWYQHPDPPRIKLLISIRADLFHQLHELQQAMGYSQGPQDSIHLKKFTPEEATNVLAVIAETEHLSFNRGFVLELAKQELANQEEDSISPVDLQILAWMIEQQGSEELRAFDKIAFQKFGGVEGLLTRFLDRTLQDLALPQKRQLAIKVLLKLTDLDRQVRAGVKTSAELRTALKKEAKPEEIAEIVRWLTGVRLITGVEQQEGSGFELAHERLIPALMRQAGKELTDADKAKQLLDRRVNEWLGNQQSKRYLLSWHELRRIQRHSDYAVRGEKRRQKDQFLQLSRKRTYGVVSAFGGIVLCLFVLLGWLLFTAPGQIQIVRWGLDLMLTKAPSEWVVPASIAYGKDGQWRKAFYLAQHHIQDEQDLGKFIRTAAEATAQLDSQTSIAFILHRNLDLAQALQDPWSQSDALRSIAEAIGNLGDSNIAQSLLRQVIDSTREARFGYRDNVLIAVAGSASAHPMAKKAGSASDILNQVHLSMATLGSYGVVGDVAIGFARMEKWGQAINSLRQGLGWFNHYDTSEILTLWAEKKQPRLIEGTIVLGVEVTHQAAGNIQLSVTLKSPDQGCNQYADWWEILSQEGQLLRRQFITELHPYEQPFTLNSDPLPIGFDESVVIRAHLKVAPETRNALGELINPYADHAMIGSLQEGFKPVRLSSQWVASVAQQDPQPGACPLDQSPPLAS